ncbi:MAG: hypothetical protein KAT27_01160, partial [Desulfobacterales bacterium]|nr:hypothetical protein [Desulfobacterales bacterium]
ASRHRKKRINAWPPPVLSHSVLGPHKKINWGIHLTGVSGCYLLEYIGFFVILTFYRTTCEKLH